jgi:murein DD-endopeptidase MepM/ murein hydrolase activator NlpD
MKYLIAALLLSLSTQAGAQEYRLPFEGRWFVLQGGDTPNVNQHMSVRAQWFGLDFGKVGGPSKRELTRGTPSEPEDFYSWGQPVLAPIDGEVVAAVDSFPDNPLGTKDARHPAGDHVVIKTASDQFVFLAHLQRGTVVVRVGRQIKRGDRVGLCGNSGNSDFPHIHMHVQDTPILNAGQGQNPTFTHIDVELTGKQFSDVSWPLIRGLFVSMHSSAQSNGQALTESEALTMAVKLANEECEAKYSSSPFSLSSYAIEFKDRRWHWGSMDAAGKKGFSAVVSFGPRGEDQTVEVFLSTDRIIVPHRGSDQRE